MSTRRAFWLATLFSLGILTTIATIGAITGFMGRMLGDIGAYGYYFVAGIFFIVGLYLLEVISIPFLGNVGQPKFEKKGSLAALILGLAFGVALGPCTFAYIAPMLAIAFSIAATQFFYGLILLMIYGIGHCSVIIVAGTSTELVQRYLSWNAGSKGVIVLKRICAVLVILAGVYLIWIA
jgi:cytochrome c-type biogenesis protein